MATLTSFLSQHFEPLSMLKKACLFLFSLGFALIAFVFFLVLSPQGGKIALNLVSELTPYKLNCATFDGALYEGVVLEDVEVTGPSVHLRAKEVRAAWDFRQLFKQDKKISYLHINNLSLSYNNNNSKLVLPKEYDDVVLEQAQANILKTLPFALAIEDIHINDAKIHWNQIEHAFKEVKIKHASSTLAHIEEIHYAGDFGSFDAYLQGAIKVNWDLNLSKNPYLADLNSAAISTKGSIIMPSRHIDDPQNQIIINAKLKDLKKGKHHFENINMDIKGNLANHHVSLTGLYNNSPIKSTLLGKFSDKFWQGDVAKFKVEHQRWEKIGNSTGNILVNWHDATINTNIELLLSEKHPVTLVTQIDKKKPYALKGSIKAHVEQLRSLAALIPAIANLRGKLNIDLALSGTLLQPQWLGNIQLIDAKLPATSLGKKAVLNELALDFLAENKIALHGKGLWGSGEFHIVGNGALTGNPNLNINLKGEKLLLSDTPEYYIVANPDLNLSLQNGKVALKGSIVIPEAEINSLKNPDSISTSDDVVVISKKKVAKPKKVLDERTFSYPIATHIDLILKDKITYKGYGISSKVGGRLEINQQPGQPPLAKGKLFLSKGSYKAYGKVFDINYGQILFTGGPIYDPILDIRAERKIQPSTTLGSFKNNDMILAGVTFSGNLKTPKIGFYSNPPMPDADVISYLIVGRPQSQINEAQAELLFQAVSQLASVVGSNRHDVHFDLAEKLKLDQLGFSKKQNFIPTPGSHNPLEDTVFVLGKQLSSRLYLNYSVGIVDSASQLGMRYIVGKNVSIEASAGTQGSSADVLLSFEGH